MRRATTWVASGALAVAVLLSGCDETLPLSPPDDPVDAGCGGGDEPRRFEVYFALDVSGSMAPFLRDVRDELEGFAGGFPELDGLGRGVRVDYFVVGFVNDYKVFGDGRMSSTLAVRSALDDAITAGLGNSNLTTSTPNIEEEENLLDALALIPTLSTSSAVKVVIVATDADFVENPAILGPGIQVVNTFAGVRQKMVDIDARVHVFTRALMPGLNIPYKNVPPLSELPGSSSARLDELVGARDRVRDRLNEIARDATCNAQRTQ